MCSDSFPITYKQRVPLTFVQPTPLCNTSNVSLATHNTEHRWQLGYNDCWWWHGTPGITAMVYLDGADWRYMTWRRGEDAVRSGRSWPLAAGAQSAALTSIGERNHNV